MDFDFELYTCMYSEQFSKKGCPIDATLLKRDITAVEFPNEFVKVKHVYISYIFLHNR